MKIAVLGAGIAGITTAYELNRDGHEVTVIERETEPASFTSYANAGSLRARPCLCLVVAGGAQNPAALAVAQRPGLALQAERRSRLLALDVAVLAAMHG